MSPTPTDIVDLIGGIGIVPVVTIGDVEQALPLSDAIATEHDTCILPGVATATELMRAARLGLEVVKLFPAEATGGIANLSALASVFPTVRFMPTGGIGPANAAAYLGHGAVLAVGGSWMAPGEAIAEGDWTTVTEAAAAAVALARSSR